MVLPVAAFEAILQGKSNPRTLCPRRKECGTRKGNGARPKTVQFNGKLQQWYHLVSCDVNHDRFRSRKKQSDWLRHPPFEFSCVGLALALEKPSRTPVWTTSFAFHHV
jgi:hypothetical protein